MGASEAKYRLSDSVYLPSAAAHKLFAYGRKYKPSYGHVSNSFKLSLYAEDF